MVQMGIPRHIVACFVVTTGVAAQASTSIAEGEHFRVVCHFEDGSVAAQALAVVEASWKPTLRVLGVRSPVGRHPLLAVHLYRRASDYEAAEAKLTRGRFKRNLAFAHFDSKTAHVAVQPTLSDSFLGSRGLNYQTLRLLIHEAAHLVRYHTTRNFRSHPRWYADGSASWLESTVLRRMGRAPEKVADPQFSTMILQGQRLLNAGKLPSLAAILRGKATELEFYQRYAAHWLLFDYLYTTERKTMDWWIANLRRLGGGKDLALRLATRLEKRLGSEAFAALGVRFRDHVKNLEPRWEEVHRSLGTGGRDWVVTAFPSRNAIAWRTEKAGTKPWTLKGSATVLPGRKTQLNLLLGRRRDGFTTVALTAGSGVTVFDYRSAGEKWSRLAFAPAPGLVVGKRVSFRVHAARGRLHIELAGEPIADLRVEASLAGPWGVGAQAGASGVWHGVELVRERR